MEERQKRALTRAGSRLQKDLKASDVMDHLLSTEVISPDDMDEIRAEPTRKAQVAALLRLLPHRGPRAFQELRAALRRDYSWLADDLETQLSELNDSTSAAAEDALEDVMRAGAVPSLPAAHIARQQYTDELRSRLAELKEGRFLGVHGMAGIGKSVCVNHALRDPALVLDHFPGGVFWVNVGQVDADLLISKVQALCERLSSDQATAPLPPNVEVAVEKLRKLLNRPERRRCLLVLDDVWKPDVVTVWKPDVVSLFDLGACVLVTTRDSTVLDRVEDRAVTVQIQHGFNLNESRKLFAMRLGIPEDNLPGEAEDIHKRCGGVPMVIALLSSYLSSRRGARESRNRWHKCLENLEQAKYQKLQQQHSYAHANVMDAIDLSVKNLDDEHADYFRHLAVFGADVGIPSKVLCTYRKMEEDDVEHCMSDLVKKSLVQEMWDSKLETMFYSMHDLIVDYMANNYTVEERRELHALLVKRYMEECGHDFGRIPDDEYMLWHMGHHVYHSGLHGLFPQLYFSLAFVGNKLRATGPSDLLSDYRKYAEFIDQSVGGDPQRRHDFENFVRTAGHRLPPLPAGSAADTSAAVVQLALCEPDASAVFQAADSAARVACDRLFFRWRNKQSMRWSDPPLTKMFSGPVSDVVFTRSPHLALAAYGDGQIKLWNVETSADLPSFRGHTERVQQLTVSPDGSRFVSASEDHTLKIWDLEAAVRQADGTDQHAAMPGQLSPSPRVRQSSGAFQFPDTLQKDDSVATFTGHKFAVTCVDWSPDGACLLSGDANGGFKVWDALGSELHDNAAAHEGSITCCTFSPDGYFFATGGADGRVKLWRTKDATPIYTFSQHKLRVVSLSLSRDNSSIVSVADNEIFCWVWSADRRPSKDFRAVRMRSPGEGDLYLCSRLSRDERQLVVGTASNMYETWDLAQSRMIATQRGFAGSVTSLVFSHDGERLLAGAGDMVASCCLTTTPRVEDSLQPFFSARFTSADPDSLVVAGITSNNGLQGQSDRELMILKGLESTIEKTTKPVGEKICITEINATGTMVAFGCEDGSVGVYEVAPRQPAEPNILGKHMKRVISLKFGPGDTVVSGSEDNTMKVWYPDKTNITCGGNDGAVSQVGLYESDDGLLAVSCSRDGTLKVYRADTGRQLSAHRAHSGSTVTCYRIVRARLDGAAAAEDGRAGSPCPPDLVVMTAAVDGTVKMSSLATGALLKTFALEYGEVRTFQLSADASLLVTGHDNGDVVVTRTDHLCPPLRLGLHRSWVRDLAISEDGRDIISVGDSLAWWRLSAEGPCARNGRHDHDVLGPPGSPRLRLPERRYFVYGPGRPAAGGGGGSGGMHAELRQVFAFRGTRAHRVVVSADWTTLVTIDDAGVLYVLQVF